MSLECQAAGAHLHAPCQRITARTRCQCNELAVDFWLQSRGDPRILSHHPMKRILFAAVSVWITCSFGVPTAQSRLGQVHWAARSLISVWIDRENMPVRGDQLVERAMRTWTTAADGAFTLRRTFVTRDAGIRIFFNGADGNYGETRPRLDPATGLINAADVAIAADSPIEVDAQPRAAFIVYLTALHELRTRARPRAHREFRRHHVSVPAAGRRRAVFRQLSKAAPLCG